MAVIFNGKTLLNPSEKGTKYCDELRNGVRQTNDGRLKMDKYNKPVALTREQRAFRSGYLTAQKDSRKCFNSRKLKQCK